MLGAGFGGLELTARLSDALGDEVEITLIDRNDSFVFGFAKLDVMFGKEHPDAVHIFYRDIARPGVRFVQEEIISIDPERKSATTDRGTYAADVLVVALGADLNPAATPGLVEGGHEFYSVDGATQLREVIARFDSGTAIVGVTSTPFKCPPAPSETALLLDHYLRKNGRRASTRIQVVLPFGIPVPPSPETSAAILAAFAERGIEFVPDCLVSSLDPVARAAVLDDGRRLPYELFLGVPLHHVPPVVEASGMAVDGWIQVEPASLATRFPDVYAVGDVTSVGTPKAGVFAEGASRVVADTLIARLRGQAEPAPYDGAGSCYIEFGRDEVARIDVNFLSGPHPTGVFTKPSAAMATDKVEFGSSRRKRWLGT